MLTAHITWKKWWSGKADLKGARQAETLRLMTLKINDSRSAWASAAMHADVKRLAGALQGMCLYYEQSNRLVEGRGLCQETQRTSHSSRALSSA